MRQLRDDTPLILDGEVRVYRRERSRRWQASFIVDGHTIRVSTGKRDLAEAKEYARDTYLEYKFRHKNDLPIVTKKFSDVARLAIVDMRKQLDAGLGKKVYRDYIVCIERYLIPFFGAQYVTSINYEKIQQFYEWRRERMGREPKASTLNTHNSRRERDRRRTFSTDNSLISFTMKIVPLPSKPMGAFPSPLAAISIPTRSCLPKSQQLAEWD